MKKISWGFLSLLFFCSTTAFFFLSVDTHLDQVLEPPSLAHWWGTDLLGRDLLLRCLQGNFLSWVVGLFAVLIAFALGAAVGFAAGWRGGRMDFFLMRLTDVFDSIPSVVSVTLLVLLFGSWLEETTGFRLLALAFAIGVTHWIGFARLTRVLVLQEAQAPYVEGAVVIGARAHRIFWVHLRPNLWPVLKQSLWAQLPTFFLFESLVSFLGFGLQPPEVSLGILLQEGWRTFSESPHLLLAPGLILFLTLFCFQIAVGDSEPPKAISRASAADNVR